MPAYYYLDHFVEMPEFVQRTYGSIVTADHYAFLMWVIGRGHVGLVNARIRYHEAQPMLDDQWAVIGARLPSPILRSDFPAAAFYGAYRNEICSPIRSSKKPLKTMRSQGL